MKFAQPYIFHENYENQEKQSAVAFRLTGIYIFAKVLVGAAQAFLVAKNEKNFG
jgi:hypothetical protein